MLPQASAQEESRVLLLVTVEVGQDTVVFASTHLGLSEESRRMQTECILNELKRSRYPVLLGGDFNAEPDAAEIAAMTSGCDLLCGMQPTFPADAPDVKIDYLFGYPAGRWTLESTRIMPSGLSDHRAIVSVVALAR